MHTQTYPITDLIVSPNLRTLIRELPADLDTPVSVYLKLAGSSPSFLLESVTGGEQLARYSFIGIDPAKAFVIRGHLLEEHTFCCSEKKSKDHIIPSSQDPWDYLKAMFSIYQTERRDGLPRFTGGLVGFVGYEMMRYFEPTVALAPHPETPDAIFMLADIVVAFDHAYGKLLIIGNASDDGVLTPSIDEVNSRMDQIEMKLKMPLTIQPESDTRNISPTTRSNMTQDDYKRNVEIAREHITNGDIFQVVLSQRFDRKTSARPFNIYRSLRRLNPSPYMFYLDFCDLTGGDPLRIIGASPEVHARLEGRVAAVRPIAGTRRRGNSPEEEGLLEAELLDDPKERAEHVMLVDLGRNDLGRICEYGTVEIKERMVVERYSHVMHIVSHVEGKLRDEYDSFDLLRATFPAGTVSGAPKIRAMQLIRELEPDPRGPYAGAVGYFSYDGSMDTCISIRTMIHQGDIVSMQAGAGIVADSVPEYEYKETIKKLRAQVAAVDMAETEERGQ